MKSLLVGMVAVASALPMATMAQTDYPSGTTAQSSQNDMMATGTIVSTSATSLVIRTDAGQAMTFSVGDMDNMPAGLVAGDRVTVHYNGSLGDFDATSVTRASSMTTPNPSGTSVPSTQRESYQTLGESTPPGETSRSSYPGSLPDTASPMGTMGLLGLTALGAGLALKAVRRHVLPQ